MSRLLGGYDFKTFIYLFILLPLSIFFVYLHGQKLTYFLRPLWQSPPKPFNILPHYYHPNASMELLCTLHGWNIRHSPRRVFDAVLFSNEVDMLTIRWNELNPYITQFVLLESGEQPQCDAHRRVQVGTGYPGGQVDRHAHADAPDNADFPQAEAGPGDFERRDAAGTEKNQQGGAEKLGHALAG